MTLALPRALNQLVASNLAAQSAEQLSLAATPIVAVLALGAGPGDIGLLAAAQTLPFLLMAMPFGLLADRSSRRRLMVAAELLRALSLLGLLVAVISDRLSIALLAGLGFAGATGTVAFSVAAPAVVPALVPRGLLARANGRLELARSLAFAAGPALAGTLVSWAGASAAFVLATMLSVAAIALLARLPDATPTPSAPRHPLLELRDGARLVWQHTLLRPILFTAVAWNIAWFVLQAAYVPYAMRVLGLDSSAVGLTLAGYGVGMVVGALGASRVAAALTPEQSAQWGAFKAEMEKDLVASAAKKQATALRAPLQLTDEQVTRLVPPMAVATQKKVDVLQKLADGGRISIRDKLQAKKGLEAANDELVKAMSAFLSPNQVAAYQAATKKK
jgi:predicted MFS family arabinose efflux permease